MVEHADTQAGRVIDELERMGVRDNTLILYVWSDNGSSAEGQNGTISEPKTDDMYQAGWAWAGSAPYQPTKLVAAHFGGTRTPLAVSWPKSIRADARPRSQFYHVNDIVPTIYDILKIAPPKLVDEVTQDPIGGVSIVASFNDPNAPENKPNQYFEVMGSRGYFENGWFASVFGPRILWKPGIDPAIATWSPDNDTWELYDLRSDFSQASDLAKEQLDKVRQMVAAFNKTAEENKVFPVGGGLGTMVLHPESAPKNPATEFHYTQDVAGLLEASAAKVGIVSNRATLTSSSRPSRPAFSTRSVRIRAGCRCGQRKAS